MACSNVSFLNNIFPNLVGYQGIKPRQRAVETPCTIHYANSPYLVLIVGYAPTSEDFQSPAFTRLAYNAFIFYLNVSFTLNKCQRWIKHYTFNIMVFIIRIFYGFKTTFRFKFLFNIQFNIQLS